MEEYLSRQREHHGYADRVIPPVYVQTFDPAPEDESRLQPQHAYALLQFHIVLASWRRRGVFGPELAASIAQRWRSLQAGERFFLRKASFVPDHVHLALRVHPAVSPAGLIVALMNASQDLA